MRYLASIIASAFFALAATAFWIELQAGVIAPPAQFIAMFFLLLFLASIWYAQVRAAQAHATPSEYYRTVREESIFPITAYAIQYCIVALYFVAWNFSVPFGNFWLRTILPKGFFIPAFIEMIITVVMISLWIGNKRANEHTDRMEITTQNKRQQKILFQEQVSALSHNLAVDPETVETMRRIEERAESLPLTINGTAAVAVQQAMQESIRLGQLNRQITANDLRQLAHYISLV